MNRVHLSGHLGEDASVQEHGGLTVARLRLGTTSTVGEPGGKPRTRIDWHRITLFDALARRVERLREGDQVTVHGELRTYSFQSGGTRTVSVEVVASEVEILPATARRLRHRSRRMPRPRLTGSHRRRHLATAPDPADLLSRLLLPDLDLDGDGEGVL